MSEITPGSDLREVADQVSTQARTFLSTVTQVASGGMPGASARKLSTASRVAPGRQDGTDGLADHVHLAHQAERLAVGHQRGLQEALAQAALHLDDLVAVRSADDGLVADNLDGLVAVGGLEDRGGRVVEVGQLDAALVGRDGGRTGGVGGDRGQK